MRAEALREELSREEITPVAIDTDPGEAVVRLEDVSAVLWALHPAPDKSLRDVSSVGALCEVLPGPSKPLEALGFYTTDEGAPLGTWRDVREVLIFEHVSAV